LRCLKGKKANWIVFLSKNGDAFIFKDGMEVEKQNVFSI